MARTRKRMPLEWYHLRLADLAEVRSQVLALHQSLTEEVGTSNRPARLLDRADRLLQQATESFEALTLHHYPSALLTVYLPGTARRPAEPPEPSE